MINTNLEKDLRTWCNNNTDDFLFTTRIYPALCQIAVSICAKRRIPKSYYDNGIINEMVGDCSIILPQKYDKSRGTAKCLSYIIMDHFLIHKLKFDCAYKRDIKKTLYIEELTNNESVARLIMVEIDEFNKKSLLDNKSSILSKIKNKKYKKIANIVFDVLEVPEKYFHNDENYVKIISKKAKSTDSQVYASINVLKSILKKNPNFCKII